MTGDCTVYIEFDELNGISNTNELCKRIESTIKNCLDASYVDVIDVNAYYDENDENEDEDYDGLFN